MIRKPRDDWSEHDSHRNPRLAQLTNRPLPMLRSRRPRFKLARQLSVERSQRDINHRSAPTGHLRQKIEVSGNQKVFRDDPYRILEFRKHLQTAPRQLEVALRRLVTIRDSTHRHRLRYPLFRCKFGPQERRGF